jgi:hypothetical protein
VTPGGEATRAALAILALAPPAVALGRHLARGLRPTERALLGLGLAPATLALPAFLLVLLVRVPLGLAFWQSEFLWVVAALWPAGPERDPRIRREPRPERGQGFPSLAAAAAVLAVVGLALSLPVASPLLRMGSEAWFQAAAAIDIRRHGLPPHDPTFAGLPLAHAWLPPFSIALLHAGTGAALLHVQVVIAAWSAGAWALAGAHLAYRVFGRPAAAVAGAVAPFGFNAIGWLHWLLHRAPRDGAFGRLMELAGITAAPAALAPAGQPLDAALLMRFWDGGERSLALAIAAVLGWNVARGLERPLARSWSRTLILALTLLLWSPDTARWALPVLLGGWIVGSLAGHRATGLANALAIGLAALLAWPYVTVAEIPGGPGPLGWGWSAEHALALVWGVGPWWLAIAPAALLVWQTGAAGSLVLGTAVTGTLGALLTTAASPRADVTIPIAWLWLAPLAAGGLQWWAERMKLRAAARLAALALLVAPTTALVALGVLAEGRSAGALVRPDSPQARLSPIATRDEQRAYGLLRDILPDDAVVIEGPRRVPDPPVPVLAERRQFFPPHGVDPALGYGDRPTTRRARNALDAEVAVRRGIQLALFDTGELSDGQRVYLYAFAAPVYLLVRRAEVSDPVWNGFRDRPGWSEVLSNDDVRLYRYRGGPP